MQSGEAAMHEFRDPGLAAFLAKGYAGSIELAFERLHSKLTPLRSFIEAHSDHRQSIESCLVRNFGMTTMFRTGSYGAGTSVRHLSDVDYFAVIPSANLKSASADSLTAVAAALRSTFSRTEGIRVDGPGVKIPFAGADEKVEIIPVHEVGKTQGGFRMFGMPDGLGGWMHSSPEAHDAFVDLHNERLGRKLKPLIRFLKAWKLRRNVPIRSFYLEMYAASYSVREKAILYPIDLARILEEMVSHNLNRIVDPIFSGAAIAPCTSVATHVDAVSKLSNAAVWARRATNAGLDGKLVEAFDAWDLVFDGFFPHYVKG